MLSQTIHVSMSSDLVYVTHLVPCYESDIFSATLSTHRIKLYTFRDDIVAHLSTFTGEGNPIVDQRFSMHSLYVCHENGRLEIWDIRSNKSIAKSHTSYFKGMKTISTDLNMTPRSLAWTFEILA